jgi:hypothetical protein
MLAIIPYQAVDSYAAGERDFDRASSGTKRGRALRMNANDFSKQCKLRRSNAV